VAESAGYGGDIRSLAICNNCIYNGGSVSQKVRKLNKNDLTFISESASYGGAINAII
jgi:predicted outer membrane repeat protein